MYWQSVNKMECWYLHKSCKCKVTYKPAPFLCLGQSLFLPGQEVRLVERVSCCKTDCREWWTSLHRRPADRKRLFSVCWWDMCWDEAAWYQPNNGDNDRGGASGARQTVRHNYYESRRQWMQHLGHLTTSRQKDTSELLGLWVYGENLRLYYSLMWHG